MINDFADQIRAAQRLFRSSTQRFARLHASTPFFEDMDFCAQRFKLYHLFLQARQITRQTDTHVPRRFDTNRIQQANPDHKDGRQDHHSLAACEPSPPGTGMRHHHAPPFRLTTALSPEKRTVKPA